MEEDYKKTILVVDDEKMIRTLLNVNLSKEGYNVIEATDGMEAVQMATEKKPDLILLDVMIPKLDGLSVCKKIKNIMNVPIVMVTAKDSELDKIVGLELGADDYVTKPFSIRELIARVKANLRKAEVSIFNEKTPESDSVKRDHVINKPIYTTNIKYFISNFKKIKDKIKNDKIKRKEAHLTTYNNIEKYSKIREDMLMLRLKMKYLKTRFPKNKTKIIDKRDLIAQNFE